jgi:HEAT repeat protein
MSKNLFGLSPATRDLVRELWQKRTLRDRLTGDQRTLRLIEEIRIAREPAAIGDLMPLGLADNRSVQVAARAAIRELVELVPFESLPILDETLRRVWGYLEYWHGLRPESVRSLAPVSIDDKVFVRLVASHRSGYVRAEALHLLSDDKSPEVIPYILLRLTDWVDQVRSAAELLVRKRLHSEFADGFVSCLPLLDRLAGSARLNPPMVRAIHGLLCTVACAGALLRGMSSSSHAVRRRCFRLSSANAAFQLHEVLDRATLDPDVMVRMWAFESAVKIPNSWRGLRERALNDPYSPIRRIVFASLEVDPETALSSFVAFLMDPSAGIRQSCQHLIDTRFNESSAAYYRSVLHGSTGQAASICVRGLVETGNVDDVKAIAELISRTSARTRSEVVRALRKFGADRELDLTAVLKMDVPSVAREAAHCLLLSRAVPAVDVWRECLHNPEPRVWLSVLKLFRHAGKWAQVQVYLEASAHADPLVSAFAIERLKRWVEGFNRSFVQPSGSDRTTLPLLFDRIRRKLPSVLERELGFVLETACR